MENDQLKEMLASYEAETDLLEQARLGFKIARYYQINLSKYEDALKYFLRALQIAEALKNEREISIVCNGLGSLYSYIGNSDKAKETLQRAISIGETLKDDSLLARPYINLGNVYSNEFNHYMAIDCFEKALRIAETIGEQELLGMATISMGRAYVDIDEYKQSIHYNRLALKTLPPDANQIFVCYINMGLAYIHLKEYYHAIGCYNRAIPLLERVNHLTGIAEMYCSIGEAFLKRKNYNRALEYLLKAQVLLANEQINSIHIEAMLHVLLLDLYSDTDKIEEAEQHIQKFLTLEVTNLSHISNFYKVTAAFYGKQQRYDLAYSYLCKYFEAYKLILTEETQKSIKVRAARFEYEREKQKAELLKQKNEELENYQKIIEQKNQELLKLHEEKDNLMNTISHDLKNFLGATQQALDIYALKQQEVDKKYLHIVATSTDRSLNLVKEILYSTKVSASKDSLSLQKVDINQVLANEEETLLLRSNKKGINVVYKYADEPLWVEIDTEKWHRIFENLITNAIKFTHTGKDIHISTKRDGDFAIISVKDSGIGIPPDNLDKLFTPLSGVGRKGTDGEESTGLGLSIVKKLVELHGGAVDVSSEVGKGTEFVVRLNLIS